MSTNGLSALQQHFGPRLITPTDDRYDSARGVWNGMIDKKPRAVLRCADENDVVRALSGAVEAGLPLSVKGGGHQIAGGAVIDDGVVLDLGGMRAADVSVDQGMVRVGGGALLGDLDRALAAHRLAVPAGVVSHTGVGGLALGGGIGWLSRSRGLTCDHLVAATVVDGGGRILRASADEHPDLFWALRGGGGSFGVVTEFCFDAQPIGPVWFGTRVVGLEQAADALFAFGERAKALPRELQVMVKLQKLDHGRLGAHGGDPMVTFEWLWSGDPGSAAGVDDLLGLTRYGSQVVERREFPAVQSQQDQRYLHGHRYYVKPGHLTGFDGSVVEAVLDAARRMPSGDAQVEFLLLGGAVGDVDEDATAYPGRDAAVAFNVTAGWRDPGGDESHATWCRETHDALARSAPVGAYINFLGSGAALGLEAVFGAQKLARLREVKLAYDPDDVFRPVVRIPPAESTPEPAGGRR